MGGDETVLCVLSGYCHEHGMSAAVDAYFHRIDIQFRHQLSKIDENACGERLAVLFFEQGCALIFAERRIERKNVVFLLVAWVFLDGPVSNDEIGESVSRAPVVVSAVVDGLVEYDLHDGIGGGADAAHRGFLLVGQAHDDSGPDVHLRAHHNELCRDGPWPYLTEVSHTHPIRFLNYSHP